MNILTGGDTCVSSNGVMFDVSTSTGKAAAVRHELSLTCEEIEAGVSALHCQLGVIIRIFKR